MVLLYVYYGLGHKTSYAASDFLSLQVVGFGPKLYFFKFWNVISVMSLIAAYPEIYAAYEAEQLLRSGDVKEAEGYHLMSAAIRISRSIRILETLIVSQSTYLDIASIDVVQCLI